MSVDNTPTLLLFSVSAEQEFSKAHLHWLDEEQRLRHAGMRDVATANRYQVAHVLLRRALGERLEVSPERLSLRYSPHGKPSLPKPHQHCHFSLSHSEDWVAIAMHEQPVGVDVEVFRVVYSYTDLVQRFFSTEEFQQWNLCSPKKHTERFWDLWTLKEAFAKCDGRGMQYWLSRHTCMIHEQGVSLAPKYHTRWQYKNLAPAQETSCSLVWLNA